MIEASGHTLHYKVQGAGPTLVLLHGFLESMNMWDHLNEQLKGSYRILTIDLPGHGASKAMGTDLTMEKMAKAVADVLEREQISKAHFMGHSMGGYVLLSLLDLQHDLFESIVLLNSTSRADSEQRTKNREQALKLLAHNKDRYIAQAIKNLFAPEDRKDYVGQIDLLVSHAKQFPAVGIEGAIRAMMQRKDHTLTLKSYTGKKLAVCGNRDPLLSQEHNRGWTQASETDMLNLDCGHMAWLEQAVEIVKIVHFIE